MENGIPLIVNILKYFYTLKCLTFMESKNCDLKGHKRLLNGRNNNLGVYSYITPLASDVSCYSY